MNEVVANITVIACIVLGAAAGIWVWWFEHKPEDKPDTDKDGEGSVEEKKK